MKITLTSIALLFSIVMTYGQATSNIKAKNDGSSIKVKWIHPEFYYSGGMDIYRSNDDGDSWEKLNPTPLEMLTEIRDGDDKKMKTFLNIMDQIASNNEGIGIAKLAVFSEIVTNEVYAKRLNLYYKDDNVIRGENYRYKVIQVDNDRTIGMTKSIKAGSANEIFEVDNPVFLYANDEGAKFKWDHDSKKYYGVNAYRQNTRNGEHIKLNKMPILVFKFNDQNGINRFPDVMMADTTIKSGPEYIYTFRPVDIFNEEGETTKGLSVSLPDTKQPNPPKNLISDVEKLTINLSWQPSNSDDVEGYKITRQDVNLNEVVIEELVKATTYTYDETTAGQYFFLVQAVDFAGNLSSSIIADGLIPDATPTSNVTGFKTEFDSKTGKVRLTWNAVPEHEDLEAYRVLRYASVENSEPTSIHHYSNISNDVGKNTTHTDEITLESQTRYKYAIYTADTVSNYSEPQYSDWITIPDIVAPMSPVILEAANAVDKITIKWLPSRDYDVVKYLIYKKQTGNANAMELIAEVSAESKEYLDEKVMSGTSYTYTIKAVDASNNESLMSNEITYSTLNIKSSEIPIDINLKAKHKKKEKLTMLKWSTSKVEDIKGYVIFKQTNNGRYVPLSGMTTDLSIEDPKAIKGETYNYQIRVYTNAGHTLKSEIKTIKI